MSERMIFEKHQGVLVPVSHEACGFLDSLRAGVGAGMEFKKVRNVRFHRKLFALLTLAFKHWEPDDDIRIDGLSIRKDFKQFRKKVLVLAGHCDAFYDVEGRVSFEAKSLAFNAVNDIEFADLYRRVLDVVWERILKRYRYRSRQEAESVAAQLIGFD